MTTPIAEYSVTDAALAELRKRFSGIVYDAASREGMETAKKDRAEVRGYRIALEKKRVEIKAPALERSRQIDIEAKRITEELLALEGPPDAAIKAEEQRAEAAKQAKIDAELKRVAGIQERIEAIRATVNFILMNQYVPPTSIQDYISQVEAVAIDDSFAEFRQQAEDAKTATLARLRDLHKAAVDREAEQVRVKAEREELARLRADQDAREAADRQRREAEEATAKAARDEQTRNGAENLRVQREAQEAEQKRLDEARAKLEADQRADVERKRVEREASEKAEAARQKAAARAKRKRPAKGEIVKVLADHYDADEKRVEEWLTELFAGVVA